MNQPVTGNATRPAKPAPPPSAPPPKRKRLHIAAAAAFAIGGLVMAFFTWRHYDRVFEVRRDPIPILEMIPTAPRESQENIRKIVGGASKLMLFLSPEQQAKTREIWKEPPRTLDDLIAKQQEMDKILTPQQRAYSKPIRVYAQEKIVDEMFEPGRGRFKPKDFDAMKDEIKRRVEKRMSGE
jgi:hypothetical protein